MPFERPPMPSFEKKPEEKELETSQEVATEKARTEEIKKEDIKSKIEKLTNDEKKLFEIVKNSEETLRELEALKYEGKIDQKILEKLDANVRNLTGDAVDPLIEKIGGKRANEIGELYGEHRENEREKNISDAKSFNELIYVLNRSGDIKGTKEYFTPDKLNLIIDKVRKGELTIDYITRTYGLRKKVEELLMSGEKAKEKLPPEPDEGPPDLPPEAEKISPDEWDKMREKGYNVWISYPSEIERKLREQYWDYPEIGAKNLRTKEGIINGILIWCDGSTAIFETPQGKIRVSFDNLLAPEGITYGERKERKEEEEYRRRMEPPEERYFSR